MKWSTLILVVVALVAVVGIAVFAFPWDWADDYQREIGCSDTRYEYQETYSNIEVWWDPDVNVYQARRIVHIYNTVDNLDWSYIDDTIDVTIRTNNPANLRELVEAGYESPNKWVSEESWHWFDCTICITQGECP